MTRATLGLTAIVVLASVGGFGLLSTTATGQFRPRILNNGRVVTTAVPEPADGVPLLVDTNRPLTRLYEKAQKAIDAGEYQEALTFLQEGILDRSEDYFVDREMNRSLKRETLKLIVDLPPAARRHYELQYGRVAEQMLAEARETRDLRQLEQIARRFFHTPAGYEATYLLGTNYLDRSSPFAAALQFDRLRQIPEAARPREPLLSLKAALAWSRAGMPEKSRETLQQLRTAHPDARIPYGGRTIPLPGTADEPLQWLAALFGETRAAETVRQETWPLFRGDAARNAAASPVTPVWDGQWTLPTIRRPDARDPRRLEQLEAHLHALDEEHRDGSFLNLPAAHPLVVGETVVVRTLSNLRGVHLKTGQLLWETAVVDPPYEQLVEHSDLGTFQPRSGNAQSLLQIYLTQRSWRDLTAGTLSSDGRHVFAVEDLGVLGPFSPNQSTSTHPLAPRDDNRLMAFEVATGKLKWEAGGPRGDYAIDLAGTFFLGPPLPLDGQLYCLAEQSGEIRLVVLDAETGRQQWSQTLILPFISLQLAPLRRMTGISPAYADGVLVCSTEAGAVVALDLTRRLMLWGHQYDRADVDGTQQRALALRARMMNRFLSTSDDDEARWVDSVPLIAEGYVLLTPRDSDELLCLKLIDGTVAWKRPRGQSLSVAAVHEGKAIVVGRTQVEALELATGKPAWDEPLPIPMPSGRGVRTGSHFHLPLSTAEIATIDLDNGRMLARSKSRSGRSAGNLVAADGTLVSQSIDAVVGFKPLAELEQQIAARLHDNANDAAALALRGEIRLHRGDEQAGLADLRQALQQNPHDERARETMTTALLEGLRHDFATYREEAERLGRSITDPQQRARYLRLYADGLQTVGERQAAFETFLKLAATEGGTPQMERINGAVSVRSDRWVGPRIEAVLDAASDEQRIAMQAAIARQRDEAVASDDPAALRRFLNGFGNLPLADQARRALAAQFEPKSADVELELLLRRLQTSKEDRIAGFATARLAEVLLQAKHYAAARPLVEELARKWADVVVLDEQTGSELVAAWRADEELAAQLAPPRQWPDNHFLARMTVRQGNVERDVPLEFFGSQGAFEGWSFHLDQRRQQVIARDGHGNDRWRLMVSNLKDSNGQNRARSVPQFYGNSVHAHGHMLVVVLGSFFAVLDALPADDSPQILWVRDLFEPIAGSNQQFGPQPRQVLLPGGGRRFVLTDPLQRPMGTVGPLTDEFLIYQIGTTLFAADPITGDLLWERRNVARGSKLFGDRRTICVLPPNATQALVLRTGDGEEIGRCELPSVDTHLVHDGRSVVSWTTGDGTQVLARHDALQGEVEWRHEFDASAVLARIDDREVAVLEPSGLFKIIATASGRSLLTTEVEPLEGLTQIAVRRVGNRDILLTSLEPQQPPRVRSYGIGYNAVPVNGPVYGFDRQTGRTLWRTPIENMAIDLTQPHNLPVLVLSARQAVFQQPGGRAFSPNRYFAMIVDTRNGEILFEENRSQPLSPFQTVADLERGTIGIDFLHLKVDLTLTDTPLTEPRDSIPKPTDAADAEKPVDD